MENNENLNNQGKANNTSNNGLMIVIIIIGLILVGMVGYKIFADSSDGKTEPNGQSTQYKECQCEKCEKTTTDYTNVSIDTKAKLICTIDMTGLTEVDVASKCGEDFDIQNDEYQIKVTNLKYNGINYTFTYLIEKDTIVPRDDDRGIAKMYVGETLISARDASLFRIFKSIKVNDSNLQIEESARTDVLPNESNFNLSKIIK